MLEDSWKLAVARLSRAEQKTLNINTLLTAKSWSVLVIFCSDTLCSPVSWEAATDAGARQATGNTALVLTLKRIPGGKGKASSVSLSWGRLDFMAESEGWRQLRLPPSEAPVGSAFLSCPDLCPLLQRYSWDGLASSGSCPDNFPPPPPPPQIPQHFFKARFIPYVFYKSDCHPQLCCPN